MKIILSICFILFTQLAGAQLVRFNPDNVATDENFFLPGFIKEQKINNAVIEFSRKEENERIENMLKKWIYYFDEQGRVSKLIKIDHPNYISPDTSWTYLYYNSKGDLRIRRTLRKGIFEGAYFEYDSLSRLTGLVITRENNFGSTAEDFKPAQQSIQFMESYSYEKLSDTQVKVKVMNDRGTVYKEGIHYFNNAYVQERDMRYVITRIRHNEKFTYDSKSRISEYVYFTDAIGDSEEKKVITYNDPSGNLKTIDHFKNGTHTNQVFYFYDKKNLMLEGDVNKEMKTGTLHLRNYRFNSLPEEQSPSRR